MPVLPALPAGATQLATGTRAFTIAPGQTAIFDASIAVAAPPPCESTAWVVAWRATAPLAAAVNVRAPDKSLVTLGSGRWGTAEMGCAWLELRNEGAIGVSGELAYALGSR